MNGTETNETSLLVSRSGIPYDVPDNRRPYQRQLAIYFILASTVLERLAFYSLVINLIITLQTSELDWDSGNSITASFIFSGISYIWTLIFATLSDAKLGRAKTILIGFGLYTIGYVFITLITNTNTRTFLCGNESLSNDTNITPLINEHCFGPVLGTLIFTAIGVGAVQANMAVFGAEQVRQSDKPLRYFDKYVVAINIGSIIATVFISYIQTFQDDPNRYFHGYIFSASSLITAILLFVMGLRFYIHVRPHDTIITKYIPVVLNAFQTKRKHKVSQDFSLSMRTNSSSSNHITVHEKAPSFLDYARAANNGKYIDRIVDDVKSLQRVIIVFLLLIPYWLVYHQIQTTFFLQGAHMYIPYMPTDSKTQVPAIWMSVGDHAAIFLGILIFNLFVYEHLETYNPSSIIKMKFIVGMIFACITMLIAGTVEKFRQDYCTDDSDISHLSILYQLIQYITMGISEVFAMVASFEFAYMAAPRSAQALIMSLRFCSLGFSSFIGDAYIVLFTRKNEKFEFSCSNREPAFYLYFYTLGGIQLLGIFVFILCNRRFKLLKLNERIINKRQFMFYSELFFLCIRHIRSVLYDIFLNALSLTNFYWFVYDPIEIFLRFHTNNSLSVHRHFLYERK